MRGHPTNQVPLVTPCATEDCENSLTTSADDYVPDEWRCPKCEDALLEQYIDELERRAEEDPRRT